MAYSKIRQYSLFIVVALAIFALGSVPVADLPTHVPERPEGVLTAEEEDRIAAEIGQLRAQRLSLQRQAVEARQELEELYDELEVEDLSADLQGWLARMQRLDDDFQRHLDEARREDARRMSDLHDELVYRRRPEPRVETIKPGDDPPIYRPFAMKHLREETAKATEYHDQMSALHVEMAALHQEVQRPVLAQNHESLAVTHRVLKDLWHQILASVEVLYEPLLMIGRDRDPS